MVVYKKGKYLTHKYYEEGNTGIQAIPEEFRKMFGVNTEIEITPKEYNWIRKSSRYVGGN